MRTSDIDLIEQRIILEARKDFWVFRQYMNPNHATGWFQEDVCRNLQQWYLDYRAGKRPVLIINTPPQHGKSNMIMDFVCWILGVAPEMRVIYASFSESLSTRANSYVQRRITTEKYQKVFPEVQLPTGSDETLSKTKTLIEFAGENHPGSFRNTTVRGSITGESLDFGIIDDPIKGREQANSPTIRETTWNWFTDDFFTRFSEQAGMISIATRWHLEDPIGKLIEAEPKAKVLCYQAIADHDEPHRKAGEALFPELKSLEFLKKRKSILAPESWLSLYQQQPVAIGGNLIKSASFKRYSVLPTLKYLRVFVDAASKTKTMNDYTVFGLYGMGENGGLYVIDILRGKWDFTPMKQRAKDFWAKARSISTGGHRVTVRDMAVEDKSAGIQLIQDLKREELIPITEIQRNTDKYTRYLDVGGYISSGYVYLPENAPWVNDFITECESFTGLGDTHDDQVDTLLDAIKYMLAEEFRSIEIWERLA